MQLAGLRHPAAAEQRHGKASAHGLSRQRAGARQPVAHPAGRHCRRLQRAAEHRYGSEEVPLPQYYSHPLNAPLAARNTRQRTSRRSQRTTDASCRQTPLRYHFTAFITIAAGNGTPRPILLYSRLSCRCCNVTFFCNSCLTMIHRFFSKLFVQIICVRKNVTNYIIEILVAYEISIYLLSLFIIIGLLLNCASKEWKTVKL